MKITRTILFTLFFMNGTWLSAQHMNVSAGRQYLYTGLKNPVTISVDGYKTSDLIVNVNGGELKKEDGKYYIIPSGELSQLIVKTGIKTKNNQVKWLDSMICFVRDLPRENTLFGVRDGGVISRGELLTIRSINAGLGDGFAPSAVHYSIHSYKILILGESTLYNGTVKGCLIPNKALKIFSILKGGALIYIYDVRATLVVRETGFKMEVNTLPVAVRLRHDPSEWDKPYVDYNLSSMAGQNIHWTSLDCNNGTENLSGKNGIWILETENCSNSVLLLKQNYNHDTLVNTVAFYQSGKTRYFKTEATSKAQGTFTAYYENGQKACSGQIKAGMDYFFELDNEKDVAINDNLKTLIYKVDSFADIAEPITGAWEFYYPDGAMMAKGSYISTGHDSFGPDRKKLPPYNPEDPYEESIGITKIVKDSKWEFYDIKGKKKDVVFEKGAIKKD